MNSRLELTLAKVSERIFEKPNNVKMLLWIKRVMCLATIWAVYYAYSLKSYNAMGLFLLALAAWYIDSLITSNSLHLYVDVVCLTIVSGTVESVFMSGELGFAACFMCVTVAVIAIFVLGLFWGNIIAFLNFSFITVLFNIDSLDWIHEAYSQKFCERFPFMMVCFLAIANFIVYGMNKNMISMRNYRSNLNELIIKGKNERSDISLKILIAMHRAMAAKSPAMAEHALKTAEWTDRLAIELGLHNGARRRYYYAGLLHDIGKIGLPDEFWDKYELTDEEYETYKKHVEIGYELLKKLRLDEISDAAMYHHEKWKGEGYKGLRGNDIPEIARIVGVANFISRLLQRGLKYDEIKTELIAEGGKAYDIRIVEVACKLIDDSIKKEQEDAIFS